MSESISCPLSSQVRRSMAIALFPVLLLSASSSIGAPATAAPDDSADRNIAEQDEVDEGEQTTVDYVHELLSRSVSSSATWMDKFFDDPNYDDEENHSSLRLTLRSLWEDGEDADLAAKVRFKLNLPRWENRLQLIVSGDSSDDTFDDVDDDDLELTRDGEKNVGVGLRYFTRQTKRHNVSIGGGVRWRGGGPKLYVQPRYRFLKEFDTWDMRFIQKIGWYDPEGWESSSSLQLETTFDDDYFFRTTGKVNWYEDEAGWFPELNFVLRKPLSQKRVVALEWYNYFETKPDDILESSVVRLRYRQRVYRRWLWFEAAPQVTFPNEDDYDWKPGIMLKLQAYLGLEHLKSPRDLGD